MLSVFIQYFTGEFTIQRGDNNILVARFKVPEHLWLQEGKLPRIASGKIDKRQLRKIATERLEQGT